MIRKAVLLLALSLLPFPVTAQPLTGRSLDNLVAFARLLGYVRYFHPSDETAKADWDRIAVAGARAAEAAAGPAELARALEEVFYPAAPTVRVFPTGTKPEMPMGLLPAGVALDLVAWEHRGLQTVPGSMFKSERVARRRGGELGKPFVVDLGGGVSALVPLLLFQDGEGTLPHREAATESPGEKPAFSGDDRAVRFAVAALAWNGPQHFFPYFDVVPVDWTAVLRDTLKAAATDPDERAFYWTLRRMMSRLQDAHAGAMHPALHPLMARLPLQWDWIEDQLVITHAAPEATGLQRGDVVLRVDGRPAAELIRGREEISPGATAHGRRAFVVFELALGAKDSEVVLDVRHPSGETATVPLRRTHPPMGPGSVPQPRPEALAELKPGILYVDLNRASEDDLQTALPRLAAAKGIVFDVRGYPLGVSNRIAAHLTDRSLSTSPYHVPVVKQPDRKGMTFETASLTVEPATPRFRGKTAFLTDAQAVSAAEGLLSLVEHYRLGEIVGSPTAGTNGNAVPLMLPGGYLALFTGLKVTRFDGSPFHGVGIRPTVPAAPTLRGVIEGRDEVLERALEVVSAD